MTARLDPESGPGGPDSLIPLARPVIGEREEELVLEVWNAGEPIPAESLGKIFEPFWRHSVSASRNGLGLGLHICSQIVRAHDGRLSVTSRREHGTQFTARLPLGAQNLRRRADRRPPSSEISRSNQ